MIAQTLKSALTFLLLATQVLTPQSASATAEPTLTVHVLNVGYADASFLRLPSGKKLMIDTGSYDSSHTLITYLRKHDVKIIDAIVLTHAHDNHYGGLSVLADEIIVHTMFVSEADNLPVDLKTTLQKLRSKGTAIHTLSAGDSVQIDPLVKINISGPQSITQEPNADSLVTAVNFRDIVLLFPGDIPPSVQKELVKTGALGHTPDFVLLPHHGDFLDPDFAAFVDSSVKVISAGSYDKWPSPRFETVSLFKDNLYRTDEDGHLSFQTDGRIITKITFV